MTWYAMCYRVWGVKLPFFTKERPKRQATVFAHYGPVLAGGRLYVASNDGLIRAFDPTNGALLHTGDKVRIDLGRGTADIQISEDELATRREALEAAGGYQYPDHQTPWQEIQRGIVSQFETGMVLEGAVKYQRLAQGGSSGDMPKVPRDNH